MAIPDAATVQVSLVFQLQGQKWTNVLHYFCDGGLNDAQEAVNLQDLVEELASTFAKGQHEDVQCLGGVVTLPNQATFGTRTVTLPAAFGDISGDPLPTTCYVVIRKYAQSKDPTKRGRVLFAGFIEEYESENQLTPSAAVVIGQVVDGLKVQIAASDCTFIPLVYSRKNETATSVFKTNLDPVVRSFHGRQAQLI